MSRRASSGPNSATVITLIALLVVLFIGGKFLLGKKSSTGKIEGTPIEMSVFLENANSLRGNSYTVQGVIDGRLQWTPDNGQIISLKVDSPGGAQFIAINIPQDLADINIEREQEYKFLIRIREGGIAFAEKINRL